MTKSCTTDDISFVVCHPRLNNDCRIMSKFGHGLDDLNKGKIR